MKRILEYSKTSFFKGVAFAVGLVTTGIVAATLSASITSFNGGDPLTASSMNGNFNAIKARLGTYCGQTVATTGDVGGYAAAKALCVSACNNETTAHVCTGHELSVSLQLGEAVPTTNMRYSSYAFAFEGANNINDCDGWTNSSAGVHSMVTGNPLRQPSYAVCSTSYSFACCL